MWAHTRWVSTSKSSWIGQAAAEPRATSRIAGIRHALLRQQQRRVIAWTLCGSHLSVRTLPADSLRRRRSSPTGIEADLVNRVRSLRAAGEWTGLDERRLGLFISWLLRVPSRSFSSWREPVTQFNNARCWCCGCCLGNQSPHLIVIQQIEFLNRTAAECSH